MLDQLRGDGQAQPGAAVLARGRAVGLREGLEDQLLLLGGMPMPVSRTAKCSPTSSAVDVAARRSTHDLAALGELDGVADQVDQDLAQPAGSPTRAVGHVGGDVAGQLQALARGRAGQRLHACRSSMSRRSKSIALEVELAGLDLREIEDVVDDRQQASRPMS